MKKILLGLLLGFGLMSYAQTEFSDDFESYNVGDYIGLESSNWTTWSGAAGGDEDAQVTDAQAASGTKSIYLSSTSSGGGPQDVVLPFGGLRTSGKFTYGMKVYVEENRGAYWNFQGTTTIGEIWSHNVYMYDTGLMNFTNSSDEAVFTLPYEFDQWIDIAYELNLDDDFWSILVNGECIGTFSNSDANVASIDIFPLGGNAFYVDDVYYTYDSEYVANDVDAALSVNSLGAGVLAGVPTLLSGSITNIGADTITSAKIMATNGTATQELELTDLSLAIGQNTDFEIEELQLEEGPNTIKITVTEINGQSIDQCTSTSSTFISAVVPAEGKGVLVEEGTGTWCGWCPRGAVFLNRLSEKYGESFVSVAVHNDDPMDFGNYDSSLGLSGYPGADVNRAKSNKGLSTASDLEVPYLAAIVQPAKATFATAALYDGSTRELTISTVVDAKSDLISDNNVVLILTEDGVSGTASGYAQSNYYAGGGEGPMGGYENLSGTVPASQMVYDHVARAIPLGHGGNADSFKDGLASGDQKVFNYTIQLDNAWIPENMHIVFALTNANGTIDNANSVKMEDALAADFISSGVAADILEVSTFDVFPNPSSDYLNIALSAKVSSNTMVQVLDMAGRVVKQVSYSLSQGDNQFQIDVNDMTQGQYLLSLIVDGDSVTKTFVVE